MFLLKPVIIILWNIFPGVFCTFLIKQVLFYPKQTKYLNNKWKIPFTPGLVYKFKSYVLTKISRVVQDYVNDSKNEEPDSRLSRWENNVFQKAWSKFEFIENIKLLPHSWKENIHFFLASLVYQVAKQFFRSFIPYLMDYYEVGKYVELIDKKIDVEALRVFYERFVYRYAMYLVLIVGSLVGVWNVIIFLIVR